MSKKSGKSFETAADDDFSDLVEIEPKKKHGGRREGSGAKKGARTDEQRDLALESKRAEVKLQAYKANMAELDFKIKMGEYVPRADVQEAAAKAFATVAQTLRSIPDNLERRLGVSSEVVQAVGDMIDETMHDLSLELERIHTENVE